MTFYECELLSNELDKYKKAVIMQAEEIETLKSKLDYIKEIAESCYDPVDKENDSLYSILQIIESNKI